ncbi:post-GPI attachment to proteins factor 2-like [Elysia marginata]|uniref:Post-GPI attachment to proteins factor 2-like n=1 Tax=Elysia marginata TaxID=1093978 RepID=A0AAV4HM99_9GAST|nr:post-GPI attachment to proteins factor 2-like [Elysia marginata]
MTTADAQHPSRSEINGTADKRDEKQVQVKNYIPSISAVTGITPQTYLWRTSIGLQAAPRLSVCFFYYNQYRNKIHQVAPHRLTLYRQLIRLNFWLNFIENSCLILVAFITNRENYRQTDGLISCAHQLRQANKDRQKSRPKRPEGSKRRWNAYLGIQHQPWQASITSNIDQTTDAHAVDIYIGKASFCIANVYVAPVMNSRNDTLV